LVVKKLKVISRASFQRSDASYVRATARFAISPSS
jgi:hypothetical protein